MSNETASSWQPGGAALLNLLSGASLTAVSFSDAEKLHTFFLGRSYTIRTLGYWMLRENKSTVISYRNHFYLGLENDQSSNCKAVLSSLRGNKVLGVGQSYGNSRIALVFEPEKRFLIFDPPKLPGYGWVVTSRAGWYVAGAGGVEPRAFRAGLQAQ